MEQEDNENRTRTTRTISREREETSKETLNFSSFSDSSAIDCELFLSDEICVVFSYVIVLL